MRKAVANWKLAQYWQDRAASALRHAQYKELPAVRARRIKGIEADIRRCKAAYTPRDNARILQRRWNDPADAPKIPHAFCGTGSRGGSWVAVEDLPKIEAGYRRWIEHYENRLAYECAMLNEAGGLVAEQQEIQVGGRSPYPTLTRLCLPKLGSIRLLVITK